MLAFCFERVLLWVLFFIENGGSFRKRDEVFMMKLEKGKIMQILTIIIVFLMVSFLIALVTVALRAVFFESKELNTVIDDIEIRREAYLGAESSVNFDEKGVINVLVLGLDARAGWDNPHCDAIHMFRLNTVDWTIDVTSVPRGTYSYIPPGNYAENEYYLANACAFAGLDYGIEQIEKIVGVKSDYYVTVGFSEVYGILRMLNLPTTESLQWLRHRQSYAIGDPQRSANQATFMKDLILSQGDKLRQKSYQPLLFVLYNFVNTNMDFGTARALAEGYLQSDIDKRPEAIRLSLKPYYDTEELHFDIDNPDEQIEKLLSRIRPYLSQNDLSDKPLEEYQDELMRFMRDEIVDNDGVRGVFEKQLWLQIEDNVLREEMHYEYLVAYLNLPEITDDIGAKEDVITAYILEKETLGVVDYVEKGKDLLRAHVIQ